MREVTRPIQGDIRIDEISVVVGPSINISRDTRQFRDKVHRVLISSVPVFGLVHSFRVTTRENAFRLHGGNSNGELRHRVGGNG